ncbi:MAG: thioredoxin family protein [Puniceicoccales bacterium]|jgi:thioredoxin|nr:thioredoxin family protein [Puniceicoccales bacterium]
MDEMADGELEGAVEAGGVLLVDFFAPWCGPCRALEPALLALEKEFQGRARLVQVNIDAAPATAARYEIRSVPTLIFFQNGHGVETVVGTRTREQLAQKLAALVA